MKNLLRAVAFAGILLPGLTAFADEITFKDPKGDDDGPGKYTYPTDTVYTKGSFDLREAKFKTDGDTLVVEVEVGTKIEDPWDSKAWEGNGFSVQMAFIFIDTDHKAGSGHEDGLPGLNIRFAPESAWDKALIISPQGRRRVQAEINEKAASVKGDIIIPTSVTARGKTLIARFPLSALGGKIDKSWGYQVIMQSNEGFPDKTDLLTRKVNEYGGQHRFGGGSDYDCDPHVMDMLAGKGQGDASEKAEQHKQLGSFTCDASGNGKRAVISMVYPEG
ncbi:MAG: hypothetical protein KC635_13025 [Myxococcales bacterium]|nr:hypothetical protein [Myxococcales bacterium]MCB9733441.1 hypothetical protein [Deltaproteobacteria bacterium]